MPGARPGKLLVDPDIWFAVNALLDGLDPGSDSPADRLKFVIYQRRMLLEGLKVRAQLLAMMGATEHASAAAQAYLTAVMPMSAEQQMLETARLFAPQNAIDWSKPLELAPAAGYQPKPTSSFG